MRKQLRKGGLKQLVPPDCDVDKQWTQVANNIAGKQKVRDCPCVSSRNDSEASQQVINSLSYDHLQKKKAEPPSTQPATVSGASSGSSVNKRKGGSSSMLADDGAALSEGAESASVGGQSASTAGSKKYKFSHAQSVACVRKFDAWGGSVAGRKKEVQELAVKLGLTVSQVKKRFDYLRQKKIKSHLDGAGTKRMVEVAVEDVQVSRNTRSRL